MNRFIDDNGILRKMTKEEIEKMKADEAEFFAGLGYDECVNHLIRAKYSESEEFSVLRKRDTNPEEFEEYNSFCEECKKTARTFFENSGGDE